MSIIINEKLKVGSNAPDFALKDHNESEFRLSKIKDKKVLLSFHPLAWTPVCADQMKSIEDNFEKFEKLNTIPVGISIDTVPSKKAWADSLVIKKTRLLSDFWPHGEVARIFKIFIEKFGFSERANIIIDEAKKIKWIKIYEISQFPDINQVIDQLK